MPTKTAQNTVALIVAMLVVAGAFVALPTMAQQGDGVTTPEPQEDGDYDCGQFETREQVNAVFDPDNDQYDLDRDGDGIACENVGEPSEDGGTPTATPAEEETSSEDQQSDDEEQKEDMKEDTEQTEDTQSEDKKKTPC